MIEVILRGRTFEAVENDKILGIYYIKEWETPSDCLGKLKLIDFIKKKENLPWLDIEPRIRKGKKPSV